MKHTEKIFRDMLKLSIAYASSRRGAWERFPMIAVCMGELEACSQRLDAAVTEQYQSGTEGLVSGKHAAFASLGQRSYKLGRKLALYAKRSGNAELAAITDVSQAAFLNKPESEILLLCERTAGLGREYQDALQGYGLEAQELDALEALLAQARALPQQVNTAASEHKLATAGLKQCVADARELLDQMDDAFEGMVDDEEFLAGWFSVRKVKGRHRPKKNDDLLAADGH